MMRLFGSEKRLSLAPAQRSSDPIDAAWPMQTVDTSGLTYCIVSYIDMPEVTMPPGELMYMAMSLFGFSDSRNRSWAQTRLATASLIPPVTKMMRSFSRSEEHTSELQSLMRISYAV